jgi:hypothetical protein
MNKRAVGALALGVLLAASMQRSAEAAQTPAQHYTIHLSGVQVHATQSGVHGSLRYAEFSVTIPATLVSGFYGVWAGDRAAGRDNLGNYTQNAKDQPQTITYKAYDRRSGAWTIVSHSAAGWVFESGGYRGRACYVVAVYNSDPYGYHDLASAWRILNGAVRATAFTA